MPAFHIPGLGSFSFPNLPTPINIPDNYSPYTIKQAWLYGGGFRDPQGNPLSCGFLTWTLSHDSNMSVLGGPDGIQIVAGIPVKTTLDMNGNLTGSFMWTNDVLTPSGSYYTVRAYDQAGLEVWHSPQVFTLEFGSYQSNPGTGQTEASPINVGTLTPTVP